MTLCVVSEDGVAESEVVIMSSCGVGQEIVSSDMWAKDIGYGKESTSNVKRGHEVVKMDVVQRNEHDFERGIFLQSK